MSMEVPSNLSMAQLATGAADIFVRAFAADGPGTSLDFSPDSLKTLDSWIKTAYGMKRRPLDTTILAIGFYAGEVLVRNRREATWGELPERPEISPINIQAAGIPDGNWTVYPVMRAYKYIQSKNPEHSTYDWFLFAVNLAAKGSAM